MTNFIQITPFIHVPDLARALAFFTDVLGFQTLVRMDEYAYAQRETVGVRIMQNQGEDGAPLGNRRFAYYIDVRDVDALYAELKPKLDALPKGDVHARRTRAMVSVNFSSLRRTETCLLSDRRSGRSSVGGIRVAWPAAGRKPSSLCSRRAADGLDSFEKSCPPLAARILTSGTRHLTTLPPFLLSITNLSRDGMTTLGKVL